MLVWKTHRGGKDNVKRERLDGPEAPLLLRASSPQARFWKLPRTSARVWRASSPASLPSRSLGPTAAASRSATTTSRRATWRPPRCAPRSRGSRGSSSRPLAPPSRYTADLLSPGTLLRRFDGRIFRVAHLEKETGYVEVEGVNEPYSQWIKIDELRFQFAPPEPPR